MSIHFDDSIDMMAKLGGSFVQALADCYYRADGHNKARLVAAFPEYFARYASMYADWLEAKEAVAKRGAA